MANAQIVHGHTFNGIANSEIETSPTTSRAAFIYLIIKTSLKWYNYHFIFVIAVIVELFPVCQSLILMK